MVEESILLPLITSSNRKYDHLRYLAHQEQLYQNHGIKLIRAELPIDYMEIQSDDMELVLTKAIESNNLEGLRDTFFLIEQTSVFFDAMGGEGPGQYFKKWWNTKSEEDLKLKFSRDPGATIQSGLALNVPGHGPLIFVNKQKGKMSMDGDIREENTKYSWLSQDDFNLYFIPEGANKVYDEMLIDEFLKYDFRKPNFDKISERLIEYSSIINEGLTPDRVRDTVKSNIEDFNLIYKDEDSFEDTTTDPEQSSLSDL